jgi:hypothetical protein
MYYSMQRAKTKPPKMRLIPALEAFEELIGRSVETGRYVHFTTGGSGTLYGNAAGALLSGVALLSYVASLTAKFGAKLITSHCQAELVPVVEDVVREAYIAEGLLDDFSANADIRFLGGMGMSYALGTMGIATREKPAAQFNIGSFGGDALIVLESAANVGAMQVSADKQYWQIPFMFAVSDYVLISEEQYAAAAYVSGDPERIGIIAGQDIIKIMIIVLLVIGAITSFIGVDLMSVLT